MNWGGGGGPEVVENLTPEMKEYIQGAMGKIEAAYDSGKLGPYSPGEGSIISDALGEADAASGDLKNLATGNTEGIDYYKKAALGEFDVDSSGLISAAASRQAQAAAKRGAQTAGMGSQVGSGRNMATQMQQDAINAAEFAQIDYDTQVGNLQRRADAAGNLSGAVSGAYDTASGYYEDRLGLGKSETEMKQMQADKDYESLRRYAELFGVGSGDTQQATGGK